MANINTLKALYQPISSAATKNVLADVSQQQKDLVTQQANQQKLMKSIMSIGSRLGKDYKGYKLAKEAGFGMDLEELKKNPEFEKHIRAGGTLEDFDQGFKSGLKGFMDWRSAPDAVRKKYHQEALKGENLIGLDENTFDSESSFELPGSSLALGKHGQSILTGQDLRLQRDDVHPFDVGQTTQLDFDTGERFSVESQRRGDKWLDKQYDRVSSGHLGAWKPDAPPVSEEETDPDEFSMDTIEPVEEPEGVYNFEDFADSPENLEFQRMLDLSEKHGITIDSKILKPRKGIAGLFGGKEFQPISSYSDVMDVVIEKEKYIDEALRNKEINKKEAERLKEENRKKIEKEKELQHKLTQDKLGIDVSKWMDENYPNIRPSILAGDSGVSGGPVLTNEEKAHIRSRHKDATPKELREFAKQSKLEIGRSSENKEKTEQYQSAKFDKEYQSLGMNQVIPEADWNQLGAKEKFELLQKHKKQIEGGGFQRLDKKDIGKGLRDFFEPNEKSPLLIDRPSPSLYPRDETWQQYQEEKFYE